MSIRFSRGAGRVLLVALAAGMTLGAAPAGRYQVDADTVLDRATGLVWQRASAPGTYTWAQAKLYCEGLVLGAPGTVWRLPTVRELSTLVDARASRPTIDTTAFPGTPASRFWTSTVYQAAASSAWSVVFSDGGVLHAGAGEAHSVRCVR